MMFIKSLEKLSKHFFTWFFNNFFINKWFLMVFCTFTLHVTINCWKKKIIFFLFAKSLGWKWPIVFSSFRRKQKLVIFFVAFSGILTHLLKYFIYEKIVRTKVAQDRGGHLNVPSVLTLWSIFKVKWR